MRLVYSCCRQSDTVSIWMSGEGEDRGNSSLLCELPLSAGTFDERVELARAMAAGPLTLEAAQELLPTLAGASVTAEAVMAMAKLHGAIQAAGGDW